MNRKTIYYITLEDVQHVALDMFGRNLNDEELKEIEDKIGDYFPLYDTIYNAINDILGVDEEKEETEE